MSPDFRHAVEILGFPGAMLSGTKIAPHGLKDHDIYWNACVFQKTGRHDAEQIWHGDLDVTEKRQALHRLANAVGTTIYVTPEQPWRFDGFKDAWKHADRTRVIAFAPESGGRP